MIKLVLAIYIILVSSSSFAKGYNVFSIGIYDFELDEDLQGNNFTSDFRYEARFDKNLVDIGPEEDNFFYLKPLFGLELTGNNATYIYSGVYLEDNLGKLLSNKNSRWIFTPSFAAGYYDDGNGKKLGNKLEFRTTLEMSYQLKNDDRIGISIGHISNANIGNKNPGVEIISLSYQKPF